MTPEELNQKYNEASWLIAKRSASAAGKALLFSSESLEDATREIAALYSLSDDEIARLQPRGASGAIASVQKVANGLLGQGTDPNASQAMKVARTAIQNGKTTAMIATLLKAGPKTAQTAAAGGSVASKGTPWGWIATATYAAGTAGWFAYNARAFDLEVFELVRVREGIELTGKPADALVEAPAEDAAVETMTPGMEVPTAKTVGSRASELTNKAGALIGVAVASLGRLRS